jgi:hypothetical protein
MNRRTTAGYTVAVVAAAVTLGIAAASRVAVAATAPGSTACQARVPSRQLPIWARAGFRSPRPRMPYVLGKDGRIAAIQFANPLVSPPSARHNNKILWVARRPYAAGGDLHISAEKLVGNTPVGPLVRRTVTGGPGPSIIDLPTAGCWQLKLRWSGRSDTLDLRYAT